MTYWTPRAKWQLIDWLCRYYPASRAKFGRMRKEQLFAIHYAVLNRIRRSEFPADGAR